MPSPITMGYEGRQRKIEYWDGLLFSNITARLDKMGPYSSLMPI